MKTNILAPVQISENSVQFYLNKRVFELSGNNVIELEQVQDADFMNAIRAFESFEFGTDVIKWYHGAARFTYNLSEGKFFWGNSNILDESFSKHILAAGAIRYENVKVAELFESLPTLLQKEKFLVLDFVATFEGKDSIVNLIKAEERVFVSRYNNSNKIARFFEAKNANEALEYVAKETGEDASSFLFNMLEGEAAGLAQIKEQINQFESMIAFLKDQREIIAGADKSVAEVKEADNLISEEIKVWESKIADLQA